MSQANATVIDPSDDFIENTHLSRASTEGTMMEMATKAMKHCHLHSPIARQRALLEI